MLRVDVQRKLKVGNKGKVEDRELRSADVYFAEK